MLSDYHAIFVQIAQEMAKQQSFQCPRSSTGFVIELIIDSHPSSSQGEYLAAVSNRTRDAYAIDRPSVLARLGPESPWPPATDQTTARSRSSLK